MSKGEGKFVPWLSTPGESTYGTHYIQSWLGISARINVVAKRNTVTVWWTLM